jgi:hypothetical protein
LKLSAPFPLATGEQSILNRELKKYENSKVKKFD